MPTYRFKPGPEFWWSLAVFALTPLLSALATLDPALITNWKVWVIAVVGACVRAGAGFLLSWINKPRQNTFHWDEWDD